MGGGQKRIAQAPPDAIQDKNKVQRNLSPKYAVHITHPSVSLLNSPVSSKHSQSLKGLAGRTLLNEMANENVPTSQQLFSLFSKLEGRVSAQEAELISLKTEILNLRTENANLQSIIHKNWDASTDSSPSNQPPHAVGGDSGSADTTPPPTAPSPESIDMIDNSDELAPLHEADITRSKRLSLILNTLKNLPDHVTTIILGDSNTHKVRGKDVDPRGNKVCVRSFSGLCIFAAVHALQQYDKPPFGKIRKLTWNLGVNDALHGNDQHCLEDTEKYIKLLYTESKRIFPNSQVSFILPFLGINAVTPEIRKELERQIKVQAPKMKLHYPPNMSNMMLRDGVHINSAGKQAYINFLTKRFTNNKPSTPAPAVMVTPTTQDTLPAQRGPAIQMNTSAGRVPDGFPRLSETFRMPPYNIGDPGINRPYQHSLPDFSELTRNFTDALTRTMQSWGSQQLRQQNGRLQPWHPY